MKRSYPYLIAFAGLVFFCSCHSSREAISFNIRQDAETQIQFQNPEGIIQKNDLLSISVSSLSEQESQRYNVSNTVAGNGVNAIPGGYLVNAEGDILFPVVGTLKAEGITKRQLEQMITDSLSMRKLLLEPVVSIRNLNYKVTVLGEVQRPGVVNVPSEKINLLEALGFAGDLTIYSNRKNVLLIREENGKRIFKKINLNSAEIFSSPYFYLKPNDIVYVEPNRTKIASASATRQWLPVVLSGLTLIVISVDRLTR